MSRHFGNERISPGVAGPSKEGALRMAQLPTGTLVQATAQCTLPVTQSSSSRQHKAGIPVCATEHSTETVRAFYSEKASVVKRCNHSAD